jgi:hypothetical protein
LDFLSMSEGESYKSTTVTKYLHINVPDPWHFGVDPDPYLWLVDPDPGGQKKRGSGGSGTLLHIVEFLKYLPGTVSLHACTSRRYRNRQWRNQIYAITNPGYFLF